MTTEVDTSVFASPGWVALEKLTTYLFREYSIIYILFFLTYKDQSINEVGGPEIN